MISLRSFIWTLLLCLSNISIAQQIVLDTLIYNNSPRVISYYVPDTITARTPVILMPDGQNLFIEERSSYGTWHIDEYLNSILAPDRPLIIGVDHGGKKRIEELTHFPNDKHGGGDAAEFENFLIDQLLPYTYSKYGVTSSHPHGIAGSSLGGIFSLELLKNNQQLLSFCGAFSPSLWFSEAQELELHQAKLTENPLVFVSMGRAEGKEHVDRVISLVTTLQAPTPGMVTQLVITGGNHNEQQWSALFPVFYQSLLEHMR